MSTKYDPLTPEEKKAIAALHRLEKRWPDTLWLFAASGSLCVMKKGPEGRQFLKSYGTDPAYHVTSIKTILCDGGDW